MIRALVVPLVAPLVVPLVVLLASTLQGKAAERIDPAGLATLPRADVIILGEVHDNPEQHRNQAAAVRAIGPKALVFEMLTPTRASRIGADNRHDAAALAEALDWATSGWPDFAMYFEIFEAAPAAVIVAGEVPRPDVKRAVSEGAATVFGDFAGRFGLDAPLGQAEQERREALQMAAHCNALPQSLLPGMVEAQRLRDATLAKAALGAVRAYGEPVVVITGNGHARKDWGLPRALATAAPDLRVLAVGQYEEAVDGVPPVDLYLLTPAAERDDPCAAFVNKP